MPKLKYISILLVFLITYIHANDWQEKLTKIKEIIDSIKIDNLNDLETIKLLDADASSIIQNLSELQKQITIQKGKLEQEELLIKILSDLYQKEKSKVLETAVAELEKGINTCNDYFQKVDDGKVTSNHKNTVTQYKESWSSLLVLLKETQLKAAKIQEANESLKIQTLKDDELQEKIKNILSSIDSYNQYLEGKKLVDYRLQIIDEWQKQLEIRLERSIYATKVKLVRDSYQVWKDSQMQGSDRDSELKNIQEFEENYATNETALKEGDENNFFGTAILPLHQEALQRKSSLEAEKKLYEEIVSTLEELKEVTKTKNAQNILSSAEKAKKQIETYQQQVLSNKISSYYRKEVTSSIQDIDNTIFSIKLELDTFAEIEKEYQNFKNTSYSEMQQEKSTIDSLLSKVSLYATLFQTQQIKGYFAENIKSFTTESQQRYQKIVAEQNAFSPLEIALKNWQAKNAVWASAKEEDEAAQKLVSLGEDYLKVYENISHYNEATVKKTMETAKSSIDKIAKEKEIFANVEAKHETATSKNYPGLEEEQTSIQDFLKESEVYEDAAHQNNISKYFAEKITVWQNELKERARILQNELVAHQEVVNTFKAWKSAEKSSMATEKSLLQSVAGAIDAYNEKIAKFEITRYYQPEIMKTAKEVRDRTFQLDSELQVYEKIKVAAGQYKKESLETYQESLKSLQTLIDSYQRELEIQKISSYYANEVNTFAAKNNELMTKLNSVVTSYKDAKSSYSGWQNNTRWQSLEEEESEIGKIENAIVVYQNNIQETNLIDSNTAEIDGWKKSLEAQKGRLASEKVLFEELKSISENNDEVFASSDEEQTRMDKIIELCDKHSLESRKKTITDHYQRSVRLRLRRAQDQVKKVKKEKADYKKLESSYNFWNTRSPWENVEEEKGAIKDCMDKIQSYNDELQFRRITSYFQEKVKEYSETLKNRQLVIAQSQ